MTTDHQPADRPADDAPDLPPINLPGGISVTLALQFLETMIRIRKFEEAALEEYKKANIPGALHVSIGQEACSTGAGAALEPQDLVIGTHRSHGDVIARGGDLDRMMAELFGKLTGYCHGKGGSMHILDAERGVLGANGIVAAGLPIAVGASLCSDMQQRDRVVLAFIGDGAVAKGNFHESLTLAAMWRTPTVILCQNNQYAVSMSIRQVYPETTIVDLARSHGVSTTHVDGNDVVAVYQATRQAAALARAGGGPSVIVADTYRWLGHNVSDSGSYRSTEEQSRWRSRDPVASFVRRLEEVTAIDAEGLRQIEDDVNAEVRAAVSFAASGDDPAPEDAFADVFSPAFKIVGGRVMSSGVGD